MNMLPIKFVLALADESAMKPYDQHTVRRLSSMAGYYLDQAAFTANVGQ